MPKPDPIEEFMARWEKAGPKERANYQLFITELCDDVLGIPHPNPTAADPDEDAYVFERGVPRVQPDGTSTTVHIDCYKRGAFVLEAKQGAEKPDTSSQATLSFEGESKKKAAAARTGHGRRGSEGLDTAMKKAYHQARHYIRDLPPSATSSRPSPPPATTTEIAKLFIRANKARVKEIVETLVTLGQARTDESGTSFASL